MPFTLAGSPDRELHVQNFCESHTGWSVLEEIVKRNFGLDIVPITIMFQPIGGDDRDMNRSFRADNLAKRLNAISDLNSFILFNRIFAF